MAIRILIVDDEPLARMSLADFLQEMGYDTIAARSGAEALQWQRDCPFDVCIVDIRMPDMDGTAVVRALHQISSGSRFLVYTGSPQFQLTPALRQMGLRDQYVIRKPVVDMQVFVELVQQLVGCK